VQQLLKGARGILEHLIDLGLSDEFLQEGAEGRAKRFKYVTTLLASEKDPAVRELAERYADGVVASRLKLASDSPEDVRTLKALGRALQARPAATGSGRASIPLQPHSARSRDRRQDLGQEVLGALMDFPELAEDPASDAAAAVVDGEQALAFAALRQAIRDGSFQNPEDVLAKLPAPIHPFALARLAVPRHERLEDARVELVDNVKKLQSLELKRETSDVTEELEVMRRQGAEESKEADALLVELFEKRRAREREHA
jgi:DNA primase